MRSGSRTPRPPLLALVGPTASGKTAASVAVAEAIGAEIVTIDSTNVYRGMDAGTAKPDAHQRARVPHHLIDLVDPGEPFSVARFQSLARDAIAGIEGRGREPLLVGGSGLYYRAVVDGLEFPDTVPSVRRQLEAETLALGPEAMHRRLAALDAPAAARIDPANARRTVRALEVVATTGRSFSSFSGAWSKYLPQAVVAAGVNVPRSILHRRIEGRAAGMMGALMAETELLLERGHGEFIRSSQIIGYAEAVACLEGKMEEEEALAATIRRIKALARRQMAWFRRDPRIRWFEAGHDGAAGIANDLIVYFHPGLPARARASTARVEA